MEALDVLTVMLLGPGTTLAYEDYEDRDERTAAVLQRVADAGARSLAAGFGRTRLPLDEKTLDFLDNRTPDELLPDMKFIRFYEGGAVA